MSYILRSDKTFDKKLSHFLKKHMGLKPKLRHSLKELLQDPFMPSLRTHKLHGDKQELRSSYLNYGIRLITVIDSDEKCIYLIDIGTHDEVY